MPKKQIPEQYKQGSSYTGVNEEMIGHKPGIVKTTVQLSYGVYKTREVCCARFHAAPVGRRGHLTASVQVKLSIEYCGFDDATPCDDRCPLLPPYAPCRPTTTVLLTVRPHGMATD